MYGRLSSARRLIGYTLPGARRRLATQAVDNSFEGADHARWYMEIAAGIGLGSVVAGSWRFFVVNKERGLISDYHAKLEAAKKA